MALGEPKFKKEHIKIQPCRFEEINEESWGNVPLIFRQGKYKRMHRTQFYPVSVVAVKDIATPELLANFIRHNPKYGEGKWVLNFWDNRIKSKRFRPMFKCLWKECKFFESCRIKDRKRANPEKYKACKANPRIISNWSKKAWIEIKLIQNPSDPEKDYTFTFFNKESLLKNYWFWESSKYAPPKKEPEELYY